MSSLDGSTLASQGDASKGRPPSKSLLDLPNQKFRCILADPPWDFDDKGSRVHPSHKGCAARYQTMTNATIRGLGVGELATDDAMLWLWTTWSHLLDGSATAVATAWGFTPKQCIPWIKAKDGKSKAAYQDHPAVRALFLAGLRVRIGIGHYVRPVSEPLLLCVKKAGKVASSRQLPGLIVAPRTKHSAKPPEAYDFIETMCDGPRLELFARGPGRPGWSTWGDQAEPAQSSEAFSDGSSARDKHPRAEERDG